MRREKINLFIIAVQESFVAIVPYLLLSSLALIVNELVRYFGIESINHSVLGSVCSSINDFTAFVVLISLAYHFSVRYSTNQIVVIFLSIAVYISLTAFGAQGGRSAGVFFDGFNLNVLSIPIVVTFLLRETVKRFYVPVSYIEANIHICRIFKYVYPFLIVYAAVTALYIFVIYGFEHYFSYGGSIVLSLPEGMLLAIRTFLSQLFWFFGIHGPHMVNAVFSTSFLTEDIFHNLSYLEFYRLFALSGGSGMGLSLIIALIVNRKDKHSLKIAKLAMPFAIFNINEILIFGLPIIFNKYLFIPFVFGPLINLSIAYIALVIHPVVFTGFKIAWTMPVFFDSYIASGGDVMLPLLQLLLLVIGAAVYLPFVHAYTRAQSSKDHFRNLENKLDITSPLKAKEGLSSHMAQRSIIQSSYKVEKIIDMLDKETLMVHYQPKINIEHGKCNSFEALLRLKTRNDQIVGPYFLEDLEKAGLAEIIDIWVCEEVKKDLEIWAGRDFYPAVSINLHPDTLHNTRTIKQIADILRGFDIEFEVIERSLLDFESAEKNLNYLIDNGFNIALDDFGVGYSSFGIISAFNISTIKIDKSMIDIIDKPKGYHVCKHIIALCRDIGVKCIAEGVETGKQLDLLKKMGIEYIQGFYFSNVIPPSDVESCSKSYSGGA